MQPKATRSPWFLMTKALLSTSAPLRGASAAGATTGWRHFGLEVAQQLRRYLSEFYETPPAANIQSDEFAPLVAELRRLALGPPDAALDWIERYLPEVLAGADAKQRLDFAAGLRDGAAR